MFRTLMKKRLSRGRCLAEKEARKCSLRAKKRSVTPVSVKKTKNNDLDFPEKIITQPSCNTSLSAAKAFFDKLDKSHPLVICSQPSAEKIEVGPISRNRRAFGKRRNRRDNSPVGGSLRFDSVDGP
mmetsp:Transcript_22432/g.33636  ORF Transcript_22432/g.33636 Transcript_22432/m.33636 type:complete len:126 (+) Transcript_22432:676-1053(+)